MTTRNIASRLMTDLVRDYGLTKNQAAGVVGNLAHESGGFNTLQEIKPMVAGSRGGYGYAQWTGPRRRNFEKYVKDNRLDPTSYEANYGFLKHEITNDPYERSQFMKVKKAKTANEAAKIVSNNYLRPGIPHMESRLSWTKKALNVPEVSATAAINNLAPYPQLRPQVLAYNSHQPAITAPQPRGRLNRTPPNPMARINRPQFNNMPDAPAFNEPQAITRTASSPTPNPRLSRQGYRQSIPIARTAKMEAARPSNIPLLPPVSQGQQSMANPAIFGRGQSTIPPNQSLGVIPTSIAPYQGSPPSLSISGAPNFPPRQPSPPVNLMVQTPQAAQAPVNLMPKIAPQPAPRLVRKGMFGDMPQMPGVLGVIQKFSKDYDQNLSLRQNVDSSVRTYGNNLNTQLNRMFRGQKAPLPQTTTQGLNASEQYQKARAGGYERKMVNGRSYSSNGYIYEKDNTGKWQNVGKQ